VILISLNKYLTKKRQELVHFVVYFYKLA